MCKEVAEGLRVIIDFNLQKSLLYAAEQQQFMQVMQKGVPARLPNVQKVIDMALLKMAYIHNLNTCYSSVKYKSTSLDCSIEIIKSAPKQKR